MTEETMDWLVESLRSFPIGCSMQYSRAGVSSLVWHAMEIAG